MRFEEIKGNWHYYIRSLATNILVVASVNIKVKDWAAYIRPVEGNNFYEEWEDVAKYGTKLDKKIAEVMFPNINPSYSARYNK